ncbi:TIGR03960 family B12-binding radical SAM protein [Thermodesulfobacteriota bacterium]
MPLKSIQDILPLVNKPSRYLGTEVNTYKKDLSKVQLKIALAFPDLYEIGTSHFGMQILYHLLNQRRNIAAERVFSPAEDMESLLRASRVPLTSLESQYPLNQFDIIGFSLLYELNYTNMLTILDLAGVPFYASQRANSDPVIIAGGPCVSNPEPVAEFFDAIVIGDGENVILEMADIQIQMEGDGRVDKKVLLKKWSQLEGVYVPSVFQVAYNEKGHQITRPLKGDGPIDQGRRVKRAIVSDLNQALFPDRPVVPYGKPVHDRLRLEVSRGCTRGCRFCQAGMIYRPVRERSMDTVMDLTDRCLQNTGYEDVSLLSLSTGDYTGISPLINTLMHRYSSQHISVSLPSFRAGTLGPELMQTIQKVRKTGFTIAPEAGSQRLRDVINKNITTDEIIATVHDAFSAGWRVIKLYFMVGLPTETQTDTQGIVDLVKTLRKIKSPNGRYGKLNVSVATFIPKPHTPFQWATQLPLEESRARIEWLRSKLRLPGVMFKWQDPEVSFLEGLWARGDRRLSRLLVRAYEKGCRFDGWSDRFNFAVWQTSIAESQLDLDFYTRRQKDLQEPLPWDHIDVRVEKVFLINEWKAALDGTKTEDCRWHSCQQCGVCDFETIAPQLFETAAEPLWIGKPDDAPQTAFRKLKLFYSKRGDTRFFGHLELANIINRAFRRAGVDLAYSKGFHPMPKISFDDPLPMGMEGVHEFFYISVKSDMVCDELVRRTNQELPEGLVINRCEAATPKQPTQGGHVDHYTVTLKEGVFDRHRLDWFAESKRIEYTFTNKKGLSGTIDLKAVILSIDLVKPNSIQLTIQNKGGKRIRPAIVLEQVFALPTEDIQKAFIIKGGIHV